MTAFNDISALVAGSHWDHDGFWWFPFALLWLVVLATIVWLVVRTLRRSEVARAREILAERFARGEIGGEEYRERLEQL